MAFNQPLAGLIEPTAATWKKATAADRLAFYRKAGLMAVKEKRAELARGIGSNGRRMKPRKHPRRDGANGPVLTPHESKSRTARLLDARATAGGVTLYWHAGIRKGQKTAWGTILGFHARGAGHLPVRDVRLSKRGINRVRADLAKWWTARLREQARRSRTTAEPSPSVGKRLKDAASTAFKAVKSFFTPKPRPFAKPTQSAAEARRKQADFLRRYPGYREYFEE